MRLKKYTIILLLLVFCKLGISQVKTNFNNSKLITEDGFFQKSYTSKIDYLLPAKNIAELMQKEKAEIEASTETKPFKLAEPTTVDIDIVKLGNWKKEDDFSFCKYTIQSSGALSSSINFDDFFLPQFSEMYIYNKNGEMITGAITETENNKNKIWGSWVYQGEILTIEIKTPTKTISDLKLNLGNIAYGYKEVYKSTKVGGFGVSGPCNINVICPQGNGWEPERNSVSLILSDNGSTWCSGALIMNTCNTNRPFYLTANHCFNPPGLPQQNVGAWRFTFQAFSPTCAPNQNTDGVVTYNGSTLRANWAASDMCLVELNNIPDPNLGVRYAGWSNSTVPASNATGIHHPRGDVMKISKANNPVFITSAFGTNNNHWQADWNHQGVTEPGSSGSPLFDQNHRIIGQLHGGPSACGSPYPWDYYGRFDLSWAGGGTNATRLSNWLDPANTGAVTTNTTDIINLANPSASLSISGDNSVCTTSNPYFIPNLPAGSTVIWSAIPNDKVTINTPNNLTTTLTKINDGSFNLIATITNCEGSTVISKTFFVGQPYFGVTYKDGITDFKPVSIYTQNPNVANNVCMGYNNPSVYLNVTPIGADNVTWSVLNNEVPANFIIEQQTANKVYFNWRFGGTNNPIGFLKGVITNSCGTFEQIYSFQQVNCGTSGGDPCARAKGENYFAVSPNPSRDFIKVSVGNRPAPIECKNMNALNGSEGIIFSAVNVYNNVGTLVKSYKTKNAKNATIQIGNLIAGSYIVEIIQGDYIEKQQIIIQK